ncbi:TPA: SycD/LcrH family type III secretion system chaperone [Salmonella enterica]|nr:CesD/SycD/LcrH family type III secretion system chaperone [Salmonella enterica subsp. diarizonae]HEA0263515.1 SycD/LcrH family type III secretion system chaperone [Salmonella enterica]HEA0268610.1 SycD/LcrH family type III secretion system chaperone [Salmonella enterica]HEA0295547.1 SycD/LcrH family type III secretion system chaperone [Salmonella enterica]HEA0304656.1 SycD/LcrH family type III secretion system chaperone [Salmonella enterica]
MTDSKIEKVASPETSGEEATSEDQKQTRAKNTDTEGLTPALQEQLSAIEQMLIASVEGISLSKIHGVTDELLNDIYAYAYDFYNKGKLDEAESFFKFLCIYNFFNADYLTGLAAVKQLKKEYKQAVDLYAIAFYNNPENFLPLFYSGQCQLMLLDCEGARESFNYIMASDADLSLKEKSKVFISCIDDIEKLSETNPTTKEADV